MRQTDGSGRWFRWVLPLLVLAAAGAVAALLVLTRPPLEAAAVAERSWAVRTVAAERRDFRPVIRHFGRLVAAREVQLETAVAGRVVEISPNLVEGGELREGELVLRLDPLFYETRLRQLEADLAAERARLAELEIELRTAREMAEVAAEQLALAEKELERQKRLVARKVASPKVLEAAEMALLQRRESTIETERRQATLESRILQQRAAIQRLEAQVVWARRELADTTLRAPFDAVVASVRVEVGRELRAHDPVAVLYDRDAVEIAFSLADSEFARLWRDGLIGREVRASWRLGEETFELRGRVTRIDDRIDRKAAGVGVYATVTENPDGAPLRPDAFLEVELPDVAREGVFVLPGTALFDGGTVYVVEGGRLVARPVRPVARADGLVAVEGELADGERVVTTRLAEIGPGLRVEVVE